MRIRATGVLLILATVLTSACDKVYLARLDVGEASLSSDAPTEQVAPLTPEERERTVSEFMSAAEDLGLTCHPDKYPMIADSYDTSRYRLSACRAPGEYTDVQLAVSDTHVTVEVHEIGGLHEPPFFRQCRTLLSQRLVSALGEQRVLVRYPYRWGREAASPKPAATGR